MQLVGAQRLFARNRAFVVLLPNTVIVEGNHYFPKDSVNARDGGSSPAQSGRDVGEDGLDHVSVVVDAELIGYGQE